MAQSNVNKNIRKAFEIELDSKMQQMEGMIMTALNYVGLQAVTHARKNVAQQGKKYSKPQKPKYTVRTGNLVSSIGYTIVKDGQIMTTSDFSTIKDGQEGSNKGKAYVQSQASKSDKGMSLIVVAGMPYAQYVEAKGYDVLNSSQLKAETEAKKKIESLVKKIK